MRRAVPSRHRRVARSDPRARIDESASAQWRRSLWGVVHLQALRDPRFSLATGSNRDLVIITKHRLATTTLQSALTDP